MWKGALALLVALSLSGPAAAGPFEDGVAAYATGGYATAVVVVQVIAQPKKQIFISSPLKGATIKGSYMKVDFSVIGCNFTTPSKDPMGCHAHKFLDGNKWWNSQGGGHGQYSVVPFNIGPMTPGQHTFRLLLIKNDA